MSSPDHHHNVYVILLDDAVALHPSVLRRNRKRDPSKPCVYVGVTGLGLLGVAARRLVS